MPEALEAMLPDDAAHTKALAHVTRQPFMITFSHSGLGYGLHVAVRHIQGNFRQFGHLGLFRILRGLVYQTQFAEHLTTAKGTFHDDYLLMSLGIAG